MPEPGTPPTLGLPTLPTLQVSVEGARLAVAVLGEGGPVLLVHGFPFSSAMWGPVGQRLAARGRRVIIPDLRGFGHSVGPTATTLGTFADDLVALLDALEVAGPVPWVGFSMGGYIAFEAWRRRPDRIGALGLVDTRAGADDDLARAARLATAARVEREGSGVAADAMLGKLFAPGTPEPLRQRVHAAMEAASPLAVAGALRAMAARPDSSATLPKIAVPTLVVVGEDDAITPRADAETLARAIPGARLRVIARAGHASPLEQPDAVAEALSTFLSLPAAARG